MIINIECQCPFCGKIYEVKNVNSQDYLDWQRGKLVQRAFPYLTPAERESIISQICPGCWGKMFNPSDNDDNTERGGDL